MKELSMKQSQMVLKTPSNNLSMSTHSIGNRSEQVAKILKEIDEYSSDEYDPDAYSDEIVYL